MIAEHTLSLLEFPKILQQLAGYSSFSASRELALELRPSTDIDEVRARQQRTDECRRLLDDHPEVTIGGARDVRPYAKRAGRGGVLEPSNLLEIAATLTSMRRLRILLRKLDPELYPFLSLLSDSLPQLPEIEQEIERAIGDDGNVLDSASPALGRIRADVRIAFARLQEKLQNMITSSEYASALQEPIITMRNGRYVVPVKAGQRRAIRGLVHDQSGSGATLYVEPIAVVDQNNRWRELQLAEQEEINRILAALSERVGTVATQIVDGVEALALLDLFFAQAKYANALRAVQPEVVAWEDEQSTDGSQLPTEETGRSPRVSPLMLTSARHPLLDQRTVVPTDMELGGAWRLLLITGPNTGGKTVALKTTGLLALMAQAGLHIPAAAPSRVPVFGQIFADIGDEQSIEQSLSTFSSHMTNIIRILKAIDEPEIGDSASASDPGSWYTVLNEQPGPALVLLDELGAGTDPVEGAALARVIIERLLERGCLGVATTHYAELKAYAYSTPGVQNASVEFNVETLAPTYKLTIGLPGRSNALAIAQRLGLEADLVERARGSVAREDAQVEDLLAGIHQEREQAASELARAQELRDDAEKYRDRLSREMDEFEAQRQAREEAARNELENELREVRSQLRRLRDDFRSVSLTRQWLEEAEQRVDVVRTEVASGKERSERRKQADAQARTLAQMSAPATVAAPPAPRPFEVGERVLVRSVGLAGEIVAIDEDEGAADVQLGGFRVRADLRELRREKQSPEEERRARYAAPAAVSAPPPPDVSLNFDMRGWRASEVQNKLDRYLNDAYLAGLPQVRLIHGKGTGALRQVVRDVLQGHPLVKSFGGGGQDGGDGVTVAQLVER